MLRKQPAREREKGDSGDPDRESPNPAPGVASTIRREDDDGEDCQVKNGAIGLVDAFLVAIGPERGQRCPEGVGGEQAAHHCGRNRERSARPEPRCNPYSYQPERKDCHGVPARQRIGTLVEGERKRGERHRRCEGPSANVPGRCHTQTVSILERWIAILPLRPFLIYSSTAAFVARAPANGTDLRGRDPL